MWHRQSEACSGAIVCGRRSRSRDGVDHSVLEVSGNEMKSSLRQDVMVMTTPGVRRQLKIIAAMTGSTMKDVHERLVSEEFERVVPVAHRAVKP